MTKQAFDAIELMRFDNPFYDNHVFGKADLDRCRLTWPHKLRMIFHPMLVQCNPDGTVFYKHDRHGRYYIYKIEKLGIGWKEEGL